jgi:hypothetical protein
VQVKSQLLKIAVHGVGQKCAISLPEREAHFLIRVGSVMSAMMMTIMAGWGYSMGEHARQLCSRMRNITFLAEASK